MFDGAVPGFVEGGTRFGKIPSFIISLRVRASEVRWNAPAPQVILDIIGSNLLTDYHILTILEVDNASTALVDTRATQNTSALY